jgi:hypothetical protein
MLNNPDFVGMNWRRMAQGLTTAWSNMVPEGERRGEEGAEGSGVTAAQAICADTQLAIAARKACRFAAGKLRLCSRQETFFAAAGAARQQRPGEPRRHSDAKHYNTLADLHDMLPLERQGVQPTNSATQDMRLALRLCSCRLRESSHRLPPQHVRYKAHSLWPNLKCKLID